MSSTPVLYISAILIWGSTWFAIKFQLGTVAPEVSLFYRFALAALVLLLYCVIRGRSLVWSRAEHFGMFMQGSFLFSINYLVFYLATDKLTSGLVAVVFSSVVIMNIFNGWLFLKKPVNRLVVLGASVGLLGIVLVFYREVLSLDQQPEALTGIGLSVLATYIASIGNIISSRNQSRGLPVLQTNAIGMAYGALLMLAYVVIRGVPLNYDWSWQYSVSLVYLALFGSVLAFGAYLTLIGRIGVDKAAYATVMFPIVALLISTLFEGYSWSATSVAGVMLVMLGNLLINGRKQRRWLGKHLGLIRSPAG